jgi:hypothetical protein
MRQTGSDASGQSERSRLSSYAGAGAEPPHIDLPADGEKTWHPIFSGHSSLHKTVLTSQTMRWS